MSVFKDEVYEDMDDLTRLIEPFEYEVNTDLSLFPDEFDVSIDMILPGICNGWSEQYFSQELGNVVGDMATRLCLNSLTKEISSRSEFVRDMFEFRWELDEEDGDIVIDVANNTMSGGKLFIAKKKIAVEDTDIEKKMASYIYETINYSFDSARDVNKKNINQIADLFGATKARQERAWRNKIRCLAIFFRDLVKERKLLIKDFSLFKRFVKWIIMYVKNGNLPAMSNIARLKIMMRSGNPIYSIKEESV